MGSVWECRDVVSLRAPDESEVPRAAPPPRRGPVVTTQVPLETGIHLSPFLSPAPEQGSISADARCLLSD